jgi:HTH-type transcriptional regulator/antitoxin HipB
MDYTIRFSAQLKEQLRSLRKARGLSQASLGALIGVNQRRIADIESHPGAVGFDQVIRLLSALGAEIVVRDLASASVPGEERVAPIGLGRPPSKGAW